MIRNRTKSGQCGEVHGYSQHKLYPIWHAMIMRCYNEEDKSFINYGKRGIDVCKEWIESIESFITWCNEHGYKKGLEIDRADNNKGYYPDNCRFITKQQNLCNKRKYKNNTTGYAGVYKHKNGSFVAQIQNKYLGMHKTAKCAALYRDAYNLARGGFFPYNFKQMEA